MALLAQWASLRRFGTSGTRLVMPEKKRQRRFTLMTPIHADRALLEEDLTHEIIGAFFRVYNELGFGFLESVYRRALTHELTKRGVRVECEVGIDVYYDGVGVGHFRADLVVDQRVVVETKASQSIVEADRKQLLNYLRATQLEVGLLLHFGPKAAYHRLVCSNSTKHNRSVRQ